jgi:hypothetical protein
VVNTHLKTVCDQTLSHGSTHRATRTDYGYRALVTHL